jgi:hypothetical protein
MMLNRAAFAGPAKNWPQVVPAMVDTLLSLAASLRMRQLLSAQYTSPLPAMATPWGMLVVELRAGPSADPITYGVPTIVEVMESGGHRSWRGDNGAPSQCKGRMCIDAWVDEVRWVECMR